LQTINFFKNIDAFCINYKLLEGCSLFKPPKEKTEFLNNFQSAYSKYGYDKEDRIIQNTYFKIYSNINAPIFFFINFEFSNHNDSLLLNYLVQEIREFNKRTAYNKK